MFIWILAALKKSSKMKETEIEKKIVEAFKFTSDCGKKKGNQKIGIIKFLTSTLYLSARLTLTLISSFYY